MRLLKQAKAVLVSNNCGEFFGTALGQIMTTVQGGKVRKYVYATVHCFSKATVWKHQAPGYRHHYSFVCSNVQRSQSLSLCVTRRCSMRPEANVLHCRWRGMSWIHVGTMPDVRHLQAFCKTSCRYLAVQQSMVVCFHNGALTGYVAKLWPFCCNVSGVVQDLLHHQAQEKASAEVALNRAVAKSTIEQQRCAARQEHTAAKVSLELLLNCCNQGQPARDLMWFALGPNRCEMV